MFYIIYKTTNKINNKFYIGKHITNDLNDGYLGSGTLLKRAIQKHGRQNFTKEILYVFDNEDDMNKKEKELVVVSENSYNLCEGGQGGFGYINRNRLNYTIEKNKSISLLGDKEFRKIYQKEITDGLKKGRMKSLEMLKNREYIFSFQGKYHSEETKQKMRKSKNVGFNNSQFGTMWITNGLENRKIKKEDIIPANWRKGRV